MLKPSEHVLQLAGVRHRVSVLYQAVAMDDAEGELLRRMMSMTSARCFVGEGLAATNQLDSNSEIEQDHLSAERHWRPMRYVTAAIARVAMLARE